MLARQIQARRTLPLQMQPLQTRLRMTLAGWWMAASWITAALLGGGVAVGALGTLVGTGGGWAVVPVFLLALKLTPAQAAATSLAVVFMNAASGTFAYVRQKRVMYGLAALFAAATVPGALLGTVLIHGLDVRGFTYAFCAFLTITAAFLLVGSNAVDRRAKHDQQAPPAAPTPLSARQKGVGVVVSGGVGLVSSVLGVGGGIIHVPFLVLVMRMPVHAATATSHMVLALTSLTGLLEYARQGQVVWSVALPMGLGAVVGAQLGAHQSGRMHGHAIRRLLGVMLLVFAIVLVWRA